jgi:hypothetical protein
MLMLTKQALRYIVNFYIYNAGRQFNQGPSELVVHLAFDLNRDPGIGGTQHWNGLANVGEDVRWDRNRGTNVGSAFVFEVVFIVSILQDEG